MGIRVLVADDHDLVRAGFCKILAEAGDVEIVGQASDGMSAVRLAEELKPDVIILDVTMPMLNGIDAARTIVEKNPNARIIMISLHHAQRVVADALSAGASAYLPKCSDPEELLLAVRAVHAGQSYLGTHVTRAIMSSYVLSSQDPKPSAFNKLSAKEREVLQLLVEGKSNKEVAAYLHLSARTVEAHRAQIMDKLDIHTLPGLTRYAIQEGLTPLEI